MKRRSTLWDIVVTRFINYSDGVPVMTKILAIIGALVAGGIGISLIPQAAHAGIAMN